MTLSPRVDFPSRYVPHLVHIVNGSSNSNSFDKLGCRCIAQEHDVVTGLVKGDSETDHRLTIPTTSRAQ